MTSAGEDALIQLGKEIKASGYDFTTITPATHERVNRRPANARATDLRGVFGWSRPFGPGVLPDRIVELMRSAGVLAADGERWRSTVRFSCYDGELFVHSAFPTDEPDSVFFGPDTYRMADAAQRAATGAEITRAVDIGTGTGAGAITVAKRAPGATVFAVDINDRALQFAAVNSALAGIGNVRPRHSDLLSGVDGEFDLIVTNPPFMIDPAGRAYRDGGANGYELSLRIIDQAAERLAGGGRLVLFTGTGITDGRDPFREAAADRLEGTGLTWDYHEVDPDVYGEELDGPAYPHAERIAVVLLTATRGGR